MAMLQRCLVLGVLLSAVLSAQAQTAANVQPICAAGEQPCGAACYKPGEQICNADGTCSLTLPASVIQELGVSADSAISCLPYINVCGTAYCSAGQRCVQGNCTSWADYAASSGTSRAAAALTFSQDSCGSVLAATTCGLSAETLQPVNCTTLPFVLGGGNPKCYATSSFKCAEGGGFIYSCTVAGQLSSAAASGTSSLLVSSLNATITGLNTDPGTGGNQTLSNVAIVGNITNTTGPSNATITSSTLDTAAATTAGNAVSSDAGAAGAAGTAGAAGAAGGAGGTGEAGEAGADTPDVVASGQDGVASTGSQAAVSGVGAGTGSGALGGGSPNSNNAVTPSGATATSGGTATSGAAGATATAMLGCVTVVLAAVAMVAA